MKKTNLIITCLCLALFTIACGVTIAFGTPFITQLALILISIEPAVTAIAFKSACMGVGITLLALAAIVIKEHVRAHQVKLASHENTSIPAVHMDPTHASTQSFKHTRSNNDSIQALMQKLAGNASNPDASTEEHTPS